MGHFALIKKKKHVETPEKPPKPGLSFSSQSLGVDTTLPVFASVRRKEKPFLTIITNAQFPGNWTPPSSPESCKTSPHDTSSRKMVKTLRLPLSPPKVNHIRPSGPTTPPNSPTNSTNATPRRKSSLTSLFMTPRQRKLQEIRLGKLPAVASDPELGSLSRVSTSSDDAATPPEIEDPSSSTTYNPTPRVKRNLSGASLSE